MRILVLGHSGLLGSYLESTADKNDVLFFPDRKELNIKDTQKFYDFIREKKIEMCINASGITNIYLCETNVEEAFKVNAYAPAECAKIAKEESVRFIHISTGFVFDGKKHTPYVESDSPSPINAYGESKYMGELFILRENPNALILRTNEIFGRTSSTFSHNVIAYIINQILANKTIAVYPIKTSPTYGLDLAEFIWSIKKFKDIKGILHAVNSGSFTYAEAAELAAKYIKGKAVIKNRNDMLKYKMPENCSLESERISNLNIPKIRSFEDALKECVREFL
ncbi:MAG: NAD(P)-dependent oxidoreductase [bacterium]